jgi:Ca-activated chloride channel family protein
MRKALVLMVFVVVLGLWSASVFGSEKTGEEGLSPYFLVQGSSDVDGFPLLSTTAEVNIAGMTALTELKQVYKNDGKKTLEAVYVFPLGTKTAINAMRMKIGNRVIEAEIHKTEDARQIYNDAKNAGKTASLLEQKRPNVFQMNVANIMPGDKVEVIVYYSESLVPESGVYGFVFPTVAGPRFTGESSPEDLKGKDNWTVTPYQHEGKAAPYEFGITVNIKAGMEVAKIWSPSHKVETENKRNWGVIVTLSPKEANGGNRDFILNYSLKGNSISTGVLLYPGKGEGENFFLAMIEPPAQVTMAQIPPREYLFIMDVSGSMYGYPLEVSKKVVKEILSNLRGQDYFNIMFFAGGANTLFDKPMPATEHNRARALEMITNQQGAGGTEILQAFTKALQLEKKEGMSRIFVTMTDGYVSVEKEVFDLMEKNLGNTNFFSFGIGTSVNRFLIEGMARAGKGEPFVVTSQDEAEAAAKKFIKYIKSPVLTDIKIKYEGFDAYDVEPSSMPDLFAERPLVLSGKYHKAKGKIIITGKTANGNFEKAVNLIDYNELPENEAVKYLWARDRIARLDDYSRVGAQVKEDVTELGLKYHLMTAYTSFVAVDKEVRATGETVTVKQPLPMPEGVSDNAVGETQAYGNAPASGYGGGMRSMAKEASKPGPAMDYEAAPVMNAQAGYKTKAAVDKTEMSEKKYALEGTTKGSLYISDGQVPAGYTLDEAEKEVFKAVKQELEQYLNNCGLTGVQFEVKAENGKVKEVMVLKYKGKSCNEEQLKKILEKVTFGTATGTLKLTFEIM